MKQSSPVRPLTVLLLSLGLASALSAHAAEKLYVQNPAAYDRNAHITEKVKKECSVENRLSLLIQEQAKGKFNVVSAKNPGTDGKALTLTILDVHGVGGGAWSGPKSITLQGTLKDRGRVIGTFTARRTSGGGVFGAYKSTCSILGRDAEALAKDIVTWLEKPTMNAGLGEIKN